MFNFLKPKKKDSRLSYAKVIGRGGVYVPEKEIIDSPEYKEMQKWAEQHIMGNKKSSLK